MAAGKNSGKQAGAKKGRVKKDDEEGELIQKQPLHFSSKFAQCASSPHYSLFHCMGCACLHAPGGHASTHVQRHSRGAGTLLMGFLGHSQNSHCLASHTCCMVSKACIPATIRDNAHSPCLTAHEARACMCLHAAGGLYSSTVILPTTDFNLRANSVVCGGHNTKPWIQVRQHSLGCMHGTT